MHLSIKNHYCLKYYLIITTENTNKNTEKHKDYFYFKPLYSLCLQSPTKLGTDYVLCSKIKIHIACFNKIKIVYVKDISNTE